MQIICIVRVIKLDTIIKLKDKSQLCGLFL